MQAESSKDERYYAAYMAHNTVSRRGLLRGVFGGATQNLAATESRAAARPPFAAPESLFVAACNGCAACVTACEFGLIQLVQQKASLDLSYASCNLCGNCAAACQRNALHLAFKADTELRPQFQSSCLQYQQQTCSDCQRACPQQAISANLEINMQRCNGCGACQSACFMSAIHLAPAQANCAG